MFGKIIKEDNEYNALKKLAIEVAKEEGISIREAYQKMIKELNENLDPGK